jgi:hypothetical protein
MLRAQLAKRRLYSLPQAEINRGSWRWKGVCLPCCISYPSYGAPVVHLAFAVRELWQKTAKRVRIPPVVCCQQSSGRQATSSKACHGTK